MTVIEQPHAFTGTQDTSAEAAESILDSTPVLRERVFDHIELVGGATDEEIQQALGMAQNTERPRRVELVQQGRIVKSGQRRKTMSNRSAIVWVVA